MTKEKGGRGWWGAKSELHSYRAGWVSCLVYCPLPEEDLLPGHQKSQGLHPGETAWPQGLNSYSNFVCRSEAPSAKIIFLWGGKKGRRERGGLDRVCAIMEAGAARDVIHTHNCTSCSAEMEWLEEGLQKAQGSGGQGDRRWGREGEREGDEIAPFLVVIVWGSHLLNTAT